MRTRKANFKDHTKCRLLPEKKLHARADALLTELDEVIAQLRTEHVRGEFPAVLMARYLTNAIQTPAIILFLLFL